MSPHAHLRLSFEPENHREFGLCECCGNRTNKVWGYIYSNDAALAAYFVEWTPGHEDRAANFDLILGNWGGDTTSADRESIAVAFRHIATGPSFMVIDAGGRQYAKSDLVSKALSREEVLTEPIREKVFSILDVIFLDDPRLDELRNGIKQPTQPHS
jgi:hypothetical protein